MQTTTLPEPVLQPVRAVFRAVAASVVPELRGNSVPWHEIEAQVEYALEQRPVAVRRQIVLFLRMLDWWSLLRHGRRLTKLDLTRRTALLHSLERHTLLAVRRGIWGLRTLVFLGYYTRTDVAALIGYRAHPDGWLARPGARRERPSGTPADSSVVQRTPRA